MEMIDRLSPIPSDIGDHPVSRLGHSLLSGNRRAHVQ